MSNVVLNAHISAGARMRREHNDCSFELYYFPQKETSHTKCRREWTLWSRRQSLASRLRKEKLRRSLTFVEVRLQAGDINPTPTEN